MKRERADLLEHTAAFWYTPISVWDSSDGTIWHSVHIVFIVSAFLGDCCVMYLEIDICRVSFLVY